MQRMQTNDNNDSSNVATRFSTAPLKINITNRQNTFSAKTYNTTEYKSNKIQTLSNVNHAERLTFRSEATVSDE